MAEQLDIVASVRIQLGNTNKSIEELKTMLDQARTAHANMIAQFGEGSKEAKETAQAVKEIEQALLKAEQAGENLDKPVKSFKQELREAQAELNSVVDKFGIGSKEAAEAAKKVANLKDSIGDAKTLTDAFNPDAKFKGLANAVQGAVGAITALQGAQALFGEESKEVAATLAKVQGALALSQGVNSVLEAKDSFIALGTSAKTALAGIRSGIAATGIGLLVVALGTIVAYWDDITEAVGGVSAEQKKLNEDTAKNLKQEQDKLTALGNQEQQLKLQGKSEKEILQLKIAQTDQAILAAEVNVQNAKNTRDAQVEISKRNNEIVKGLANLISLPITGILAGVDLITEKLNSIGVISDEQFKKFGNLRDKFTGGIANLIFDPEKTKKEGDDAVAQAEKTVSELKEKRAGFQNSINAIDKAAADKAAQDAKAAAEKQKQLEEQIAKDREDRAKRSADRQNEIDKQVQENRIAAIKDGEYKERLLLDTAYDDKVAKLIESEAQQKAALDESLKNKLISQAEYNKQVALINAQSAEERKAIDENYNNAVKGIEDKYQGLRAEAAKKSAEDDKAASLKRLQDATTELEATQNNEELAFQTRKDALDQEQILLDQAYANKLLSDDEYTKRTNENSESRVKIQKAEVEARKALINQTATLLNTISDLVGKNTKAGKAAAIAGLVIQQAQTVAQVTTDTIASTKAIAKKYAGIPGGQIPAAIEIGINVAQGAVAISKAVQAVKKGIAEIKGANANSSPSGAADVKAGAEASAPIPPQAQTTTIDQAQVNQLASANATVRAYVVESDVTGSQERITRLNRAARIN